MATLNFGAKKLHKFSFLNSGCNKRLSFGLGVATGIYLTFNGTNDIVATCTPLPGLGSVTDDSNNNNNDLENDTTNNNNNNNINNNKNNLKPIKKFNSSDSKHNHDAMDYFIDLYGPSIISLGSGGAIGFCVGYAAKTIGKMVAFIAGVGFVGLQTASYYGYIEIDWLSVQKEVTDLVDINGDGKIDTEDLHLWWHGFKDFVTYAMPSSSGFAAGFVMGMRMQ